MTTQSQLLYTIVFVAIALYFKLSYLFSVIIYITIYGFTRGLISWGRKLVESDPNRDIIEGLKRFDERSNM